MVIGYTLSRVSPHTILGKARTFKCFFGKSESTLLGLPRLCGLIAVWKWSDPELTRLQRGLICFGLHAVFCGTINYTTRQKLDQTENCGDGFKTCHTQIKFTLKKNALKSVTGWTGKSECKVLIDLNRKQGTHTRHSGMFPPTRPFT